MKKKLFIAVLFLIPLCGFSQTTKPIEGFLGIKFGSSKAAVLAAMRAKGAILDTKHARKDALAFSNVKLGVRRPVAFLVKFVNDKVYEADYVFVPDVEPHTISEYNDLVNDITKIYGEGNPTTKYTSPYTENNDEGDKIVGLKLGNIDFHTLWFDAKKNTVLVSITTDMTVNLQYQDSVLTDEAIAKQDAQQKSDF